MTTTDLEAGRRSPGPPGRRPPRRLSRPSSPLLVVLVVLLVGLGVIWATGGLRPAPAEGVRSYPSGQPVELRRWQLVVDKAELTDTTSYDSPQPTALRIWMTLTWTGDQSTYAPVDGLVTVTVPGGPQPGGESSTVSLANRSGGFDPDVARPLVLDFTWPALRDPDDEKSQPTVPRVPDRVQVVIRDERQGQNFLFDDDWRLTGPIGHVDLPVSDVRK